MDRRNRRRTTAIAAATPSFFEPLESRRLLSGGVSVTLDGQGNLGVEGTSHGDHIAISMDHHHHGMLDVVANGHTHRFNAASVSDIHVDGGAGNDKISVDSSVSTPATLLGGEGNDTLTAGSGDDEMDGGNGNDQCDFHSNSGIPFGQAPAAVQTGLTTLAQGATITDVQVFQDDGQTYYGAMVTINNKSVRIVVDANGNPVSDSEDHGDHGDHHGDHHAFGTIVSVDTVANTITVNVGSEHAAPQQMTFKVDPAATITVAGVAATLGSLPAGAWVHLRLSQTDPTDAVDIRVFGKHVEGSVASVDTGAGTITLNGEDGGAPQTYNVDPSAVITLADGSAGTLASITAGMDVNLKFSIDGTTVTGIKVDEGDQGENENGDHEF
jgi:hypothetical protein